MVTKKAAIVGAVAAALLAALLLFRARGGEPAAAPGPAAPSFRVRVVVPRLGLPFAGILPDGLASRFDLTPRELGFHSSSPGAAIRVVGADHLELVAEGWELSIQSDRHGRVMPESRLVFPLGLGGTQTRLRCRAVADAGSIAEGRFRAEFDFCEDAATGTAIDWPPAPLAVSGRFAGLPSG
jgi:hypothetical protein